MPVNQNAANSDDPIFIIDADCCIVDTHTALINCLGAVSNIDGSRIYSPWKDAEQEEPRVGSNGGPERQEHLDANKGVIGNGAITPAEPVTAAKAPQEETVHSLPAGGAKQLASRKELAPKGVERGVCASCNNGPHQSDTCLVAPASEAAKGAKVISTEHQGRLRELIRRIRDDSGVPNEVVEDAVRTAGCLLEEARRVKNERFESIDSAFGDASVAVVLSDQQHLLHESLPYRNCVHVTPFQQFVEDIALSSYQSRGELGVLQNLEVVLDRLCSEAANLKASSGRVIFVSHLPGAVDRLLKLVDVKVGQRDVKIEVALRENVVSRCANWSRDVRCVLYPKESVAVQAVAAELSKARKEGVAVVPKAALSAPKATGAPAGVTSDKVDLRCEPDLASIRGLGAIYVKLNKPLYIQGTVVKGFGRGAAFLGIPTANLDCGNIPHLVPGVYFGTCWLFGNSEVGEDKPLAAILSVGFNPQFDDASYSVEPYIYHEFKFSLLGQRIKLAIEGFQRTEAKFESVEGLVAAIQTDLAEHKIVQRCQDGCH
ncbi:riboflavin kinase / FAD synthetase domain containing protein, putative [Babesia bigemina]|uniref:riboflavin kinase n=1 Tax=Babesia bigemina TaxID=5866 RepID=A0A061D4X1_BABBI|nr:riboflavin kinase / FAD synthetase domain containing protein, putative [Babesia bigemina]CDR95613.1 riboflavin kinase / FAD synthetase domain containing protein, putative [Babesia bigemina]|eukprot:XP_012767799.1 riboflavin kinase / FAD synthetase domain containing protein, putative [Babesia bigemina]